MLKMDLFFKSTKRRGTCEYNTLLAQQTVLLNISWRLYLTIDSEDAFDEECVQFW